MFLFFCNGNFNKMTFLDLITPINNCNIKTIILKDIDCLRANTIRDEIIKNGYQLMTSSLYPNEIRIHYIDNINNYNIAKNSENNYNIIQVKKGRYPFWS